MRERATYLERFCLLFRLGGGINCAIDNNDLERGLMQTRASFSRTLPRCREATQPIFQVDWAKDGGWIFRVVMYIFRLQYPDAHNRIAGT